MRRYPGGLPAHRARGFRCPAEGVLLTVEQRYWHLIPHVIDRRRLRLRPGLIQSSTCWGLSPTSGAIRHRRAVEIVFLGVPAPRKALLPEIADINADAPCRTVMIRCRTDLGEHDSPGFGRRRLPLSDWNVSSCSTALLAHPAVELRLQLAFLVSSRGDIDLDWADACRDQRRRLCRRESALISAAHLERSRNCKAAS